MAPPHRRRATPARRRPPAPPPPARATTSCCSSPGARADAAGTSACWARRSRSDSPRWPWLRCSSSEYRRTFVVARLALREKSSADLDQDASLRALGVRALVRFIVPPHVL